MVNKDKAQQSLKEAAVSIQDAMHRLRHANQYVAYDSDAAKLISEWIGKLASVHVETERDVSIDFVAAKNRL